MIAKGRKHQQSASGIAEPRAQPEEAQQQKHAERRQQEVQGRQEVDQPDRVGAEKAEQGPRGIKRVEENAGLAARQEGAAEHLVLVEQRDLALPGHGLVDVFVGRQEMRGVVVAQEKARLERLQAQQQH